MPKITKVNGIFPRDTFDINYFRLTKINLHMSVMKRKAGKTESLQKKFLL